MPLTNYFINNNGVINLVLQVSDSNIQDIGTNGNIFLGTWSQMMNKRDASVALNFFYFGVLLLMGLYHLWLYIFRTDDVSKLYFGSFCIIISLRTLLACNKCFLSLQYNLSYILALKLEHLTFIAGVYFILSYMLVVFKQKPSNRIKRGVKLFFLFFSVTTILISPLLESKLLIIFQIFTFNNHYLYYLYYIKIIV